MGAGDSLCDGREGRIGFAIEPIASSGHQRRLKTDFTSIALPVLSHRVAIFFFADDTYFKRAEFWHRTATPVGTARWSEQRLKDRPLHASEVHAVAYDSRCFRKQVLVAAT